MSAVVEWALWLAVVMSVAAGRDAWRENNWSMFVVACCVGGVFASHLRNHLRTTLRAQEGE